MISEHFISFILIRLIKSRSGISFIKNVLNSLENILLNPKKELMNNLLVNMYKKLAIKLITKSENLNSKNLITPSKYLESIATLIYSPKSP